MKRLFVFLMLTFALVQSIQAATLEETFKKRTDAKGLTDITLSNTNGNIEVSSWERDEIEVIAYKKVRAESDERAERMMSSVKIKIEDKDGSLHIETILPKNRHSGDGFFTWLFNGGSSGASVNYEIKIPKQMDMEIHSTNGAITVTDCKGDFDLSTTNGKIRAEDIAGTVQAKSTNGSLRISFRKISTEQDMRFRTTNGSIKLYLPVNTNADFEAHTTNGSIKCELPLTEKYEKSRKRLEGEINNGGALISARTTNGSIRVMEY